ncbi:hypothetical protein NDU88_006469 [Pleurodeles waltl]|uniref:Uncharacterized protein n=1 Tax=Pleurodeles waltl TaxID=8319 RepID=A0AAV7LQT5_PLEWA|nr:hypothetical protein NDU88_006469 [Pleurodeles waltl]
MIGLHCRSGVRRSGGPTKRSSARITVQRNKVHLPTTTRSAEQEVLEAPDRRSLGPEARQDTHITVTVCDLDQCLNQLMGARRATET